MKKMKKISLALLLTVFLSMLSLGCGGSTAFLSCPHPLDDAAIKQFYSQKIRAFTSDSFTVDIQSSQTLNVVTKKKMLGPDTYADVPNGRHVSLQITLKLYDGSMVMFHETFEDSYTLNGDSHPIYATENFIEVIALHDLKKSFAEIIKNQGLNDYVLISDPGDTMNNLAVFLCCSDYNKANKILSDFKEKVEQKHTALSTYNSYGVYIVPDKAAYDSLEFGKLYTAFAADSGLSYGGDVISAISGKTVTRIGSSDSFDKQLFTTNGEAYADSDKEYKDYRSFDYLIFWAHAEPNTQSTCHVQLFGVK